MRRMMGPRTNRLAGSVLLGLGAALAATPAAATPPAVAVPAAAVPDFESEVLPVLERRCFACHGPLRQRGNLRLDSRPAMLIGGGRGAAIVPGDAEASLLVAAIRREDELEMPPPRALDDSERELIEVWIAAGAEWPAASHVGDEAALAQVAAREVPPVAHAVDGPGEPLSFSRDVRPILSDNCFACHGPDEAVRQAGLRLDREDSALGLLPSGRRALVPGSLGESQLFQRVAAADALDRMPPPHAGSTLTEGEIGILGRFILQGAEFEDHWAYRPPRRPEPPDVAERGWARGDLDRFVLARLEREGLAPAPEADRRTLARRLSLDLTGLPPPPAEVEAFVADDRPDAWERQVDRLLASERYGEHMARSWLDAARYADTNGYHIDNERFMWRWRDWVIDAFNRNQPFDEFTVDQLAGDLLPDPTPEQLLATGFNRNHMINFEGGAIPEEYRVQYVFDRTDTTATVWMGLTASCAKCHDHKFDPISQREYYELAAFFNTVDEVGLDGSEGNAEPRVLAPDGGQRAALVELTAELGPLDAMLDGTDPDAAAAQAAWQREWNGRLAERWRPLEVLALESRGGARMDVLDDGSVEVSGENPPADVYVIEARTGLDRIGALRLQAFRGAGEPGAGIGRGPDGSFILTEIEVSALAAAGTASGANVRRGAAGVVVGADDAESGLSPLTLADAYADYATPSMEVELAIDGDPETGWGAGYAARPTARTAVFLVGAPRGRDAVGVGGSDAGADNRGAVANGEPPSAGGSEAGTDSRGAARNGASAPANGSEAGALRSGGLRLRIVLRQESAYRQKTLRRFRLTVSDAPEVAFLASEPDSLPAPWPALAAASREFEYLVGLPEDQRTEEQATTIRHRFRRHDWPPWRPHEERYGELSERLRLIESAVPTTMIMREMDDPRPTFVLRRGEYDQRTDEVEAGVPAVLPPIPDDLPKNRLGLARWLVSGDHPLTARVTANRMWQKFFGRGLVATSGDFGAQGEWPSHPELLDWLATELVRRNWDLKALQKTIVLSATYRQSARASPELIERDPENRLLARASRFRLDAEVIRDAALAASGLLVEKLGGPSVRPYQPPGLWREIGYESRGRFSAGIFEQDRGEALYRRSLYTFWKRTVPPPNMLVFDAPNRETCVVERSRSNTPLQALVLMNDPQFVEAARVLAEDVLARRGGGDAETVDALHRRIVSRPPTDVERDALLDLVADLRRTYAAAPAAATALLSVGERPADDTMPGVEVAAWTVAASALFNLDEAVTRQ